MHISRAGAIYARLRSLRNKAIILRMRLSRVAPTTYVHASSSVARDLVAADYVYIGRNCLIPPLVSIGRYTMLAPSVCLVGDDHNSDQIGVPMQFAGRPAQRPTIIGADVWIGQSAIIMRGTTIGDGAVIAAGSIVTKSVPEYEVWAGIPARKLRDRFTSAGDRERHTEMLRGQLAAPSFAEPLDEVTNRTDD